MRAALGRVSRAPFVRFLLVGAVGFAADVTLFVLWRLVLPDLAARLAALGFAVTATWWLNRRLTFLSDDPARFAEWLRYVATSAAGAGANAMISLTLLWMLPGTSTVIAVGAGSVAALAVNFVLSSRLAFRRASSHRPAATPYSSSKVEGTLRVPAGGS